MAPAFIARTVVGTSAWPVMKMIGIWMSMRARVACKSRPLAPGSRRSSTRQSGRLGKAKASNSSVEPKLAEAKPTDRKRSDRLARTSGSSSTIRTSGMSDAVLSSAGASATSRMSVGAPWMGASSAGPLPVIVSCSSRTSCKSRCVRAARSLKASNDAPPTMVWGRAPGAVRRPGDGFAPGRPARSRAASVARPRGSCRRSDGTGGSCATDRQSPRPGRFRIAAGRSAASGPC